MNAVAAAISVLSYAEKQKRAHIAVSYAIKTGQLKRPAACETCSRTRRVDSHHPDYDELLTVVWLCRSCHRVLHPGPNDAANRRAAQQRRRTREMVEAVQRRQIHQQEAAG